MHVIGSRVRGVPKRQRGGGHRVGTILAKVRGYREQFCVFALKIAFLDPKSQKKIPKIIRGGQSAFFLALKGGGGAIFHLWWADGGDCPCSVHDNYVYALIIL